MSKSRFESFSDDLFSIIITIMVLQLTIPATKDWSAIFNSQWLSALFAYTVSFVLITSFWVSHQNIVANLETITPSILWANSVFLFLTSLVPIFTAWFGQFPDSSAAAIAYGTDYTLSILALYFVAGATVNKINDPKQRDRLHHVNRGRLTLVGFGAATTALGAIWPPIAGIAVFTISSVWIARTIVISKRRR